MKRISLTLIFSIALLAACTNHDLDPSCTTRAVVRDLRGLDGCGFVFELEDGTRLEPVRMGFCGTMSQGESEPDPLSNFHFTDGKNVKISYELVNAGSICMVGQTVKITCITEERSNNL